jgi:chromosome segregation ATPase
MLYTPKTRTLKEIVQDVLDTNTDIENQVDGAMSTAEASSSTLETLKDDLADAQEEVSYLASDLDEALSQLSSVRAELEDILEFLETNEQANKAT